MKTKQTPTSSITPEMIGHYRQLLALRQDHTDRLDDHGGFGNRVIAWFRRVFTPPLVSTLVVTLCIVLFGFSALDKYINRDSFMVQMGKSPLMTGFEPYLKWAVPVVELAICLVMIWPKSRQVGLYAFYTVMVLFSFYIMALLRIDETIPCGCNALTEKMSLQWHVGMNLAFCGLAVWGVDSEHHVKRKRKEAKVNTG